MNPDPAASVKARLLARARASGEEFERTLARFAAERFLFRLGASPVADRLILKGASLLAVWLANPYRATRDVDVLACGSSDDASIHALVKTVCAVPCPEDALRFDLSELIVETIRAEEGYPGKRARFPAWLGSARIRLQLDLGFGDAVAVAPELVRVPTILEALPAPRVRAYPREVSVAEKFEAMVKLDVRNSRMKDFHDVWALARSLPFDGILLQRAIAACFQRRGTPWTEEPPRVLTPAFYRLPPMVAFWHGYAASGSLIVPPPADFADVGETILAFLGPLRQSILASRPFETTWPPGGPWANERARPTPGLQAPRS